MSTVLPSVTGIVPGALPASVPQPKAIDLPTLKKGAKDYLDFADETKEIFYTYLYHRTGSATLARTLLSEIYLDILSGALSVWHFGSLNLMTLLKRAELAIHEHSTADADIDAVYLPSLVWLTDAERASVGTLHESLWTLPEEPQRLLILSMLVGLSDERIAELTGMVVSRVTSDLQAARELLLSRWQPIVTLKDKLQSLVFEPGFDLAAETALRMALVEKYNALRMRKYQWVMIGGIFAVLSNVIVASVLAFTVVVAPPTSLRGTRTEVASLDAVLLRREMELLDAKKAVSATFEETQRIAAYGVSRDLTALGLASALDALKSQREREADVNRLLKLLKRADTAFEDAIIRPMMAWMQRALDLL